MSEAETLVRRLMAVVSGRLPTAEALEILAPDIVCHMGRLTTRGTAAWVHWVEYLRSRGVAGLEAEVDRVDENGDGTVTAVGRIRGVRGGRPVCGEGAARYRVQGGRITEIWTARSNYEPVFGARARHPVAWLAVLAHMSLWSRLRATRRPEPFPIEE